MPTAVRQSAFAKRRRLNDGTPTSITEPEPVPVTKSTKTKVSEKKVVKGPSIVTKSTSIKVSSNVPVTEVDEENAFGALVEADIVKFSGTREIEWVDNNTAKIRISRGQKCSFEGIARLWVRDGAVTSHGARLQASASSFPIFAPDFDIPATIEAESKVAEIQLESIGNADGSIPSMANMPACSRVHDKDSIYSFRVNDSDPETKIGKPSLPSLLAHEVKGKTSGSRKLMYGRKSIETFRAVTQLINHSLSTTNSNEPTILLLDLDAQNPMFGLPGTIGIFDIRHFVLGPAYAYPILSQSQGLLESFYIGTAISEDSMQPSREILDSLLQPLKGRQDTTLIIRPASWFGRAPDHDMEQFCKYLKIDTIISVDRSQSLGDHDTVQRLSKSIPVEFIHAPPSSTGSTSALTIHQKTIQSHFRAFNMSDDLSLWFGQAVPRNQYRSLALSYAGGPGAVQDLFVSGGILRESDVAEVMDKALVTIVIDRSNEGNELPEYSSLAVRTLGDEHRMSPIGLAFIEEVDEGSKVLKINSPVVSQIVHHQQQGHRLGMVLAKPDEDGRNGRNLLVG